MSIKMVGIAHNLARPEEGHMPASHESVTFVLVVDASADAGFAAAALGRARDSGRGRTVVVACGREAARMIGRHASRGVATFTVQTRDEAAEIVNRLAPLRVGLHVDDPVAFARLLVDRRGLPAAA